MPLVRPPGTELMCVCFAPTRSPGVDKASFEAGGRGLGVFLILYLNYAEVARRGRSGRRLGGGDQSRPAPPTGAAFSRAQMAANPAHKSTLGMPASAVEVRPPAPPRPTRMCCPAPPPWRSRHIPPASAAELQALPCIDEGAPCRCSTRGPMSSFCVRGALPPSPQEGTRRRRNPTDNAKCWICMWKPGDHPSQHLTHLSVGLLSPTPSVWPADPNT